ncbi:ankyrin repeat-containing protein C6C3.08-like [Mangifera indica]|uniref:ankyrin repeat-containing protein C6C3.08-like n=1 Tax=Mangifera indica TaxID=29780 RepID=UPI001CF9FEBF|nr:ankyrin repeat-containing protein C6C3.08-like [Mangifera indica]
MEIQAQEAAQNDTQILYEASMRGCVATLNTLIQNDPFILHKISLTPFTETPLHISALLGHVEFTKAIVSQKPQLVTELDSFKRSPLHLAAAEGHGEIVKELLIANKDLCLVMLSSPRLLSAKSLNLSQSWTLSNAHLFTWLSLRATAKLSKSCY